MSRPTRSRVSIQVDFRGAEEVINHVMLFSDDALIVRLNDECVLYFRDRRQWQDLVQVVDTEIALQSKQLRDADASSGQQHEMEALSRVS